MFREGDVVVCRRMMIGSVDKCLQLLVAGLLRDFFVSDFFIS